MTKRNVSKKQNSTKGSKRASAKAERPIPFVPADQPVDAEIKRAAARAGLRSVGMLLGDVESYVEDLRSCVDNLVDILIFIEPSGEAAYIAHDTLKKTRGAQIWLENEATKLRVSGRSGGAS